MMAKSLSSIQIVAATIDGQAGGAEKTDDGKETILPKQAAGAR